MTTSTAAAEPTIAKPSYRAAGFGDVLRSEWTKARTVRSTLWTLVVAAVLGIGLGALISALAAQHYAHSSASARLLWDPTSVTANGLAIAQLAIGVLGVLLITSEYSTGAIGSTLAAVPRRQRLLAGKAVVVLALVFVVTEIIRFAAFFIGQALISGHAPTATLGQPGVLRALIGCGLYGALIGLLGLALGTILRSAAGAHRRKVLAHTGWPTSGCSRPRGPHALALGWVRRLLSVRSDRLRDRACHDEPPRRLT